MSIAQIFCASIMVCAVALLAIKPEPSVAVAVVSMVALFIGVTLIEKKQSTEFDILSAQVKELNDKVQMLLLNKGFGR